LVETSNTIDIKPQNFNGSFHTRNRNQKFNGAFSSVDETHHDFTNNHFATEKNENPFILSSSSDINQRSNKNFVSFNDNKLNDQLNIKRKVEINFPTIINTQKNIHVLNSNIENDCSIFQTSSNLSEKDSSKNFYLKSINNNAEVKGRGIKRFSDILFDNQNARETVSETTENSISQSYKNSFNSSEMPSDPKKPRIHNANEHVDKYHFYE